MPGRQRCRECRRRGGNWAEPGLREVRRPAGWSGNYRALARAYTAGALPDGWEPQAAVTARFEHAVSGHARIAAAREQSLIAGTHGLALTVWLASRMPLTPDPAAFWAALQFPDLIEVNVSARTAEHCPR